MLSKKVGDPVPESQSTDLNRSLGAVFRSESAEQRIQTFFQTCRVGGELTSVGILGSKKMFLGQKGGNLPFWRAGASNGSRKKNNTFEAR